MIILLLNYIVSFLIQSYNNGFQFLLMMYINKVPNLMQSVYIITFDAFKKMWGGGGRRGTPSF